MAEERPAARAPRPDWVDWAVDAGYEPDVVDGLTVAQIQELPDDPGDYEAPAPDVEEAAEVAAPTPESIGIEGVVRVGGHHLDEEQGWVPDDESLPEPDDASDEED